MNDTSAPTLSQRDQILAHLKEGKRLTPLDALVKFKCLSLSQRIGELKRAGYRIVAEDKVLTGENGKKKRIAEYRLEPEGAT